MPVTNYSVRKAVIGCTRAARRAGNQQASIDTNTSAPAAPPNTTGSAALT